MSQTKKLIPIPFKRRMQNFQSKVVPLLVFGVAIMVTAMLWHDAISPAMLTGEVTTVKATMNSPSAATVESIRVQRLQMVKAGDVIAELRPNDPRQALDLIQGHLSVLRLQASASDAEQGANSNQRRERMDFERLRLDWLLEKVNLATATAKAKKAAMDLELAQGMDSAPASSRRYVQEAELLKQSADAEVTARTALVDNLGLRIKELNAAMPSATASEDERLTREIDSLEGRIAIIESSQSIITLHAPMTGIVTEVLHRVGENVVVGEVLIIISATQPERIVGYLRQPFPLEPFVGQQVEVRTHGRERLYGLAAITRVGATFEPILNAALHPATTPEVGLPVEVSLPPNLQLRPGELVSLVIRASMTNKSAL
jgi:multidrug resistance efflux pump